MKCEVFPILSLRIKSAIYCTVFSNFLFFVWIVITHLKDVTNHLGQLLVGFQQLFNFVQVTFWQCGGHPLHTLGYRECSSSIQHLAAFFWGSRGAKVSRGEAVLALGGVVALPESGVTDTLQR